MYGFFPLYSIRANQLLAYTICHVLFMCTLLTLCTWLQSLGYGTHIYTYTHVFIYVNMPNWLFFSAFISTLTPVKESVSPPFEINCNPWNIHACTGFCSWKYILLQLQELQCNKGIWAFKDTIRIRQSGIHIFKHKCSQFSIITVIKDDLLQY